MADPFNWTCPTCGAHTTITDPNHKHGVLDLWCKNTGEAQAIELSAQLIECPNPDCKAQAFSVSARFGEVVAAARGEYVRPNLDRPVGIGSFTFLPTTAAPLSSHVPQGVLKDYNEAYLISKLSPKAAATLARRALQGMVRDFFQVLDLRTLHAELKAIEDKCDPDLYAAMMAVKSIGNIGAHPEQDVNLIVEVDAGEPEALLQLIHLLDREWYVARADRNSRIAKMREIAASKAAAPPAPPAA